MTCCCWYDVITWLVRVWIENQNKPSHPCKSVITLFRYFHFYVRHLRLWIKNRMWKYNKYSLIGMFWISAGFLINNLQHSCWICGKLSLNNNCSMFLIARTISYVWSLKKRKSAACKIILLSPETKQNNFKL